MTGNSALRMLTVGAAALSATPGSNASLSAMDLLQSTQNPRRQQIGKESPAHPGKQELLYVHVTHGHSALTLDFCCVSFHICSNVYSFVAKVVGALTRFCVHFSVACTPEHLP